MANLTPFITERQLARAPAGAQTGGGAVQLPGIPAQQGGQGLGQFASAIAQVGETLANVDLQFARAKGGVLGVEALSGFLDELQQTEAAIIDDPSIFPSDRAQIFRERLESRIGELKEAVPLFGQETFLRGANNVLLRTERTLRDQGRQETIARGAQSRTLIMDQLQRAAIAADNDVDRQQIQQSMREITALFAAQGVITPEAGATDLQKRRDMTAITRMRNLIVLAPEDAMDHLHLLVAGKPGLPGFPSIPAAFLGGPQGLVAEAENAVHEDLRFQTFQEAQAVKIAQLRSGDIRAGLIERMVTAADDAEALQALLEETRTQRGHGFLLAGDAEAIQRLGLTLIDKQRDESRNETTPAALRAYFRLLLDDPKAATDYVVDYTGNGLGVGAATGLMTSARTARDERHYRNLIETKDAITFVEQQLGTTGDPLLDTVISVEMSGIRADAVTEMLTRIAAIAGPDGLNRAAVLEVLPAIRDQVVLTHRTRLKALIEGQTTVVGTPQTRSIRDAVRQWRYMLQQGVPKYEADAFLGRELARHSALAAPEDQLSNAAGIAAELEEALKE